jgi:hypothetical protein
MKEMIQSAVAYIVTAALFFGGLYLWAFIWVRTVYKKRARREIRALVHGIMLYVDRYDRIPLIDHAQDEQPLGPLLHVLCGAKWDCGRTKVPLSGTVAELNPDGTNFIPSLMGKKTVNDALLDPWGEPYHIALDTNDDRKTEISCEDNQSILLDLTSVRSTKVKIAFPAAVWSNGVNRRNECGYGDDVCSWNY